MASDAEHPSHDRRARKRRRQRGSALLEAAFVTPVFFVLIFGILEFGFLFRNYLTVANTTREGSRTASVSGSAPEADFLTLRTIEHAFAAWGVENLDFVVIYHASGPNDTVPLSCKSGPVGGAGGGLCNYYRPSEFNLGLVDNNGDPTDYFRCGSGAVDRHWCPSDRLTGLSEVSPDPAYNDGPSYIGVYVQAQHTYITGLFGEGTLLTDDRIIRIEPDRP